MILSLRRFALCTAFFLLVCFTTMTTQAQTSVFTYQGRLTDTSMPATGSYDFEFALYSDNGTQIGTSIQRTGVVVSNGVFTTELDFGVLAFPSAERFLEIRVKRQNETAYTPLTPRQRITSAPFAIRAKTTETADNAITANNAVNATNLNNQPASQYVLTNDPRLNQSSNSNSFIQNTTAAQTANFNITGSGTIGGTLTANNLVINAAANQKALEITKGRIVLSYATALGGTTEANAGAISNDAAVVEATDNTVSGAAATVALPATAENGTVIVIGTSDPDGAVVFGVSGSASFAFNTNQSARFTRIAGAWKFLP